MSSKHYIDTPDTPMRLHASTVHIWRADLDAIGARFEHLLDERERERRARIVREPARRRWMAARGLLRALLGVYLEEQPSLLRFTYEAHGKPILDLPHGERLHFNLSHSGALAIYAFTEMCAVGVDVELLAQRHGADTYPGNFLRAWVKREAEGKRLGMGVRNTPGRASAAGHRSWIAEFDLGAEAVGAVALASPPVDFRVYPIDFRVSGSILPASEEATRKDEPKVFE
jgi:phosphopantetheinyl transferase